MWSDLIYIFVNKYKTYFAKNLHFKTSNKMKLLEMKIKKLEFNLLSR